MAKLRSPLYRSLVITLLFQLLWLLGGVLCTLTGMSVAWTLLIANLLTLWAPALLIKLTGMQLPEAFQINFALFITSSSLIGSSLGGYANIPQWDTIVHIYSGVLLGWFGIIVANQAEKAIKKQFPVWFKGFVAFMTPLGFASLWEIYEYTSDTLWGTSMQAGGLEDTIIDMLAALMGAIIVLVVGVTLRKRK